MRKRDKYGRPKYPQLIKAEKERVDREIKEAWIKKLEEKKQLIQAGTPAHSQWVVAPNGTMSTMSCPAAINQPIAQQASGMLHQRCHYTGPPMLFQAVTQNCNVASLSSFRNSESLIA